MTIHVFFTNLPAFWADQAPQPAKLELAPLAGVKNSWLQSMLDFPFLV